jgi:uncharacterized alkaline shock family protein YloU
MTTTLTSPVPDMTGVDSDSRGRTTVAEHAVERIAAQLLTEVENVGGTARRLLGVTVGGEDPDRDAQVTATVTGGSVALETRLSVTYPASVSRTTENARSHLMRRVEELTGLAVSHVDIVVTALHNDTTDVRRVR